MLVASIPWIYKNEEVLVNQSTLNNGMAMPCALAHCMPYATLLLHRVIKCCVNCSIKKCITILAQSQSKSGASIYQKVLLWKCSRNVPYSSLHALGLLPLQKSERNSKESCKLKSNKLHIPSSICCSCLKFNSMTMSFFHIQRFCQGSP